MATIIPESKQEMDHNHHHQITSGKIPRKKVFFKVKRSQPYAKIPSRGSQYSAGYDLYASTPTIVPANGHAVIETGLQISISPGYYLRIAPRSGLAAKNKIDVGAGVIDSDYRGLVGVILFNHDKEKDLKIEIGDRIAQGIITKIETPEIEDVTDIPNGLDETQRGNGGFGSTGGVSQNGM